MYFRSACPTALTFLSVVLLLQKVGHPWCIQWVHARCSRVKGSLKNAESLQSLRAKGIIIYITCIRPAMLYGSETWPTKIEDIRKMQRSEMRMLR